MRRHLLYNVWAAAHTDEWRLNVQRLVKFAGVFNGRRIILVKHSAQGQIPTAPLGEILGELSPLGEVEVIERDNDPGLGEVKGFIEALGRLESQSPDEAVFYAHTKGVKYGPDIPEQILTAIRRWRDRMYTELLRDADRIERQLSVTPTCGCFLQLDHAPPVPPSARWHYAGTFWWVRSDALFNADWRNVDSHTHGVEGYLGKLFPPTAAHSFCQMTSNHRGGLYTVECYYRCERCKHRFRAFPRMKAEPVKVCPNCFKRRGRFEAIVPSPLDV